LPPRSPDPSPLDFFFWGFIKDSIYTSPMPVYGRAMRLTDAIAQSIQQYYSILRRNFSIV
jgi:cell shape-determining protein MreD